MRKIESIFRIEFEDEMVLQALILCFVVEIWILLMVNNNSTGATAWLDLEFSNPSRSGIPAGNPRRESGIHGSLGSHASVESQTGILRSTGVWDPSRGTEWIPDSVPREWILGPTGSVWDCCWGSRGMTATKSGTEEVPNGRRFTQAEWKPTTRPGFFPGWQTDGRTDGSRRRTDI